MLLGFLLLSCFNAEAQRRHRNYDKRFATDKFLDKQVWVGVRGGGNLLKAVPVQRYSAFSSSTGQNAGFEKTYGNFSRLSGHAGLEITFFYKKFSVSFQPGYRRMSFEYSNQYRWEDPENAANLLVQNYQTLQKMDYLEFPLFLRFEPLKTKIRPFVQAGWYFGRLNNALKQTTITVTDQASGGSNEYVAEQISVEARELFIRSNMGWIIGAGGSFPIGNARIALDVNYIRNTHNITSVPNRYSNERLTGSGDIMDDIKLRDLSFSFSVLIPLRFVILKENYKVN